MTNRDPITALFLIISIWFYLSKVSNWVPIVEKEIGLLNMLIITPIYTILKIYTGIKLLSQLDLSSTCNAHYPKLLSLALLPNFTTALKENPIDQYW